MNEEIEVLDVEDIPKKENKKLNLIFVIIIIIGLIGLFTVLIKNNQEGKLISISKKLTIENAINDNIDSDIHCVVMYADVEKAIKDFYIRYGEDINSINSIMEESKLKNILSIENYKSDGPEFNTSIDYIKDKKKEVDKYADDLMKICSEEFINNNINNYTKNGYAKKLYSDLVERKKLVGTAEGKYGENKKYKETVDNQFDGIIKILTFLKDNKDNWKIDSNIIKFNKQELLDQYNNIISQYKK